MSVEVWRRSGMAFDPQNADGPAPIDSVATYVTHMTRFLEGPRLRAAAWFRGHAGAGWPLLPGVLRDDFRTKAPAAVLPAGDGLERAEQLINDHFRRYAATLLPSDADLVHIYFLAQHHGLPTRLLDWTANPLMALFVSVAEHRDEDGEVIALSVDWRLSEHGDAPADPHLPVPPVSERDPLIVNTVRYLFREGPRPEQALVVPLSPDLRSDRMLRQDACFTLHMPGSAAIRETPGNARRFPVPAKHKRQILEELDALGVNWATLFRDLDNVARQIRSLWEK